MKGLRGSAVRNLVRDVVRVRAPGVDLAEAEVNAAILLVQAPDLDVEELLQVPTLHQVHHVTLQVGLQLRDLLALVRERRVDVADARVLTVVELLREAVVVQGTVLLDATLLSKSDTPDQRVKVQCGLL